MTGLNLGQGQWRKPLLLFSCALFVASCGSHGTAAGQDKQPAISSTTASAFGSTFAEAAAVPNDGTPMQVNRTDNSLVNEGAAPVAIETR